MENYLEWQVLTNMSFSIDSKSLGKFKKDNVENLTGGGRADDLFGSSDDHPEVLSIMRI